MKIALIDVPSNTRGTLNKDVNGGYGTVTSIGNSPLARVIEYLKKSNVRLPILSFGYLAAIFKEKGFEVTTRITNETDAAIVYGSIVDYKNEINFVKRLKEKVNCKVGFIGPFPSSKPELFIEHCDFVIQGEPEHVALNSNKNWKPKGIIKSKNIEDLNTLPFPDWSIFPKYSYFPVIKEKPFLVIQSSRGCSFNCGYYCPYVAAQGSKWRHRSVKNVIDEMKYLKRNFKVKGLLFRDPVFSLDKQRTAEIAKEIIKNRLNIKWACETRLDLLDTNLIDLLYKAGLRAVNVGIESEDENILKSSKRIPIKKSHQEKIIKYCDKKGINVSAFYILGLLEDTKESILKTIKYAKKLNTHVAQFTINTPIPGTGFYEEFKDKLTTNDFEKFNTYNLVFKHKNLTRKQLMKLKEKAFVSYYFRLKYIFTFFRRML
jgi:anaerobic magnesium-protoporphyrin IX monomethyl ester cyclase